MVIARRLRDGGSRVPLHSTGGAPFTPQTIPLPTARRDLLGRSGRARSARVGPDRPSCTSGRGACTCAGTRTCTCTGTCPSASSGTSPGSWPSARFNRRHLGSEDDSCEHHGCQEGCCSPTRCSRKEGSSTKGCRPSRCGQERGQRQLAAVGRGATRVDAARRRHFQPDDADLQGRQAVPLGPGLDRLRTSLLRERALRGRCHAAGYVPHLQPHPRLAHGCPGSAVQPVVLPRRLCRSRRKLARLSGVTRVHQGFLQRRELAAICRPGRYNYPGTQLAVVSQRRTSNRAAGNLSVLDMPSSPVARGSGQAEGAGRGVRQGQSIVLQRGWFLQPTGCLFGRGGARYATLVAADPTLVAERATLVLRTRRGAGVRASFRGGLGLC